MACIVSEENVGWFMSGLQRSIFCILPGLLVWWSPTKLLPLLLEIPLHFGG
jgi:hypothetical protein